MQSNSFSFKWYSWILLLPPNVNFGHFPPISICVDHFDLCVLEKRQILCIKRKLKKFQHVSFTFKVSSNDKVLDIHSSYLKKYVTLRNCVDSFPQGWSLSGASISASRIFHSSSFLSSGTKVTVSPSATLVITPF